MTRPFSCQSVLDILAADVEPNAFYEFFYEEARRLGVDLISESPDVVRVISALALNIGALDHDGQVTKLCRAHGISPDKADRIRKRLRANYADTSADRQVYPVGDLVVRVVPVHEGGGLLVERPLSASVTEAQNTISFAANGAQGTAESKASGRITTLTQLLAFAEVDESVWEVTNHVVNKWEVGAQGEDGQIVIEPLFQIKASLRKRVLDEPAFPPLQPIRPVFSNDTRGLRSYTVDSGRDFKRALIVTDPQMGFKRDIRTGNLVPLHDRDALAAALAVAAEMQPDRIVLPGDWVDFAEWTDRFVRTPEFSYTTQPTLAEASWWIAQFRAECPDAEIDFIEGNHEQRLNKALLINLQAAYGVTKRGRPDATPVLSMSYLLGLDELGVNTHLPYPQGELWLNEKVRVIHGEVARAGAGRTASSVLNQATESTVYGHIHRIELFSRLVRDRTGHYQIYAMSPGCLCELRKNVVPSSTSRVDWQQGIGVVDYEADGRRHAMQVLPIEDGVVYFEGKRIEGTVDLVRMSHETGYDFRPIKGITPSV